LSSISEALQKGISGHLFSSLLPQYDDNDDDDDTGCGVFFYLKKKIHINCFFSVFYIYIYKYIYILPSFKNWSNGTNCEINLRQPEGCFKPYISSDSLLIHQLSPEKDKI